MNGSYRTAKRGESVESIAFEYGHFWKTVWYHPENEQLRLLRGDPHVLANGDRLFVPPLQPAWSAKGTDRRHRFLRKGIPSRLHIILLAGGKVQADVPYALEIDGVVSTGRSGQNGSVIHPIMPGAREARIRIGEGFAAVTMPLELRALNPLSMILGVQTRLRNLGYQVGELSGELDAPTRAALAKFRNDRGLVLAGENGDDIDEATRKSLQQAYGH